MAKAKVVKAKQQYDYVLGFAALVLCSLALYALIQGFALHLQAVQTGAMAGGNVLLWYFAGVLLLLLGKMAKLKVMSKK